MFVKIFKGILAVLLFPFIFVAFYVFRIIYSGIIVPLLQLNILLIPFAIVYEIIVGFFVCIAGAFITAIDIVNGNSKKNNFRNFSKRKNKGTYEYQ